MKNLITFITLISLFAATQLSAQTKYTRIGIMAFKMPETPVLPEGVSSETKWIVPPIFLENEKRFLKYFTLGSEIQFSRLGIDHTTYGIDTKHRSTNIGLEIQGKISIPLVEMFEVYGQFGLGYLHSFHNTKTFIDGSELEQSIGIGNLTKTIAIGGSVILGESIGLFVEAGLMKSKTTKTLDQIVEDSMSDYGTVPVPDLGEAGTQRIKGENAYAKIGIVFQINP